MDLVRKDSALSVKVSRSGGFKCWALKLGLELKESETTKGWKYEEKALKDLTDRGYNVKEMTTKHPYDLLVEENVRIDVKVSSRYYYEDNNYYHTLKSGKDINNSSGKHNGYKSN